MFKINSAIDLNELNIYNIKEKIISIEDLFNNYKMIELNDRDLKLFLNGVMLTKKYEDNIYRIYNKNNFIGLGVIKNELLKRDVIL